MTATGSSKRSAKRTVAATAASDQRPPPSTTIGRSAAHSRFCSRAMSARPGHVSTASTRGASAASATPVSMSSGSATTTGPGRPCMATRNARATSSGTRAGSSISTAHLASVPKTAL